MNLLDLLRRRALLNRSKYQQKLVDDSEQGSSTTTYLGWNASVGMGILRDSQGSIFCGNPITNGALGIGDPVRYRQGAIPRFDAMPGVLPPMPQNQSIVPGVIVGFLQYPSGYYELVLCSILGGSVTVVKAFGIIISTIVPQGFFDYDGMAWSEELFIFINTETTSPSLYKNGLSALVLNTNSRSLSQVPINLNFTSFPLVQSNLGISDFSIAAENLLGRTNQSYVPGLNISVYKYQCADRTIRYVAIYGWTSEGPSVNLFNLYGLENNAELTGNLEGFSRSNYLYFWDLGTLDDIVSEISQNQNSIACVNPASVMGFWTIVDQIILPDFHPLTGASATSYAYEGAYFGWNGGYGSVGGIVVNLTFQPTNEAIQIFVPESNLIGASANFIGLGEYTTSNNLIFSKKPSAGNIATSLTLPNYTQYIFNLNFFDGANVGVMPQPLDTRTIVYKTLVNGQQLAFWTTPDDAASQIFI